MLGFSKGHEPSKHIVNDAHSIDVRKVSCLSESRAIMLRYSTGLPFFKRDVIHNVVGDAVLFQTGNSADLDVVTYCLHLYLVSILFGDLAQVVTDNVLALFHIRVEEHYTRSVVP